MSPLDRIDPSPRDRNALRPPSDQEDDTARAAPRGSTPVTVLTRGTTALMLVSAVALVVYLGRGEPTEGGPLGASSLSQEGQGCTLAFAPDGTTLASVNNEGTITLWDVRRRRARGRLRRGEEATPFPRSLAYSPEGASLAVGNPDGTVTTWDLAGGREPVALRSGRQPVYAVAFSPDGATLAAACDEVVRLWDIASGRPRVTLMGPSRGVLCVAFAADGGTIAAGDASGALTLWEVATGRVGAVLRGHVEAVRSVAFSPDGATLATAGAEPDHAVRLWDLASGRLRGLLRGHEDLVMAVAFSPDGTVLASASYDRTVRLWNVTGGGALATLRGHRSLVRSLAFAPDGAVLASGSDDGDIPLWDVGAALAGSTRVRPRGGVTPTPHRMRLPAIPSRPADTTEGAASTAPRASALDAWDMPGAGSPRARLRALVAAGLLGRRDGCTSPG